MRPNFKLAFCAVNMVLSCLFIWVVISLDNRKMSFLHNFMRAMLQQWVSNSKIPSGYFAALLQGFVVRTLASQGPGRNGNYIDGFANQSILSSALTPNSSLPWNQTKFEVNKNYEVVLFTWSPITSRRKGKPEQKDICDYSVMPCAWI